MTRNPLRFSASEWLDPPILIAGEVHNSSSSSPKYMEPIWEKADRLNLNTLVLPVTWEMVEEKEGNYNFLLVDLLIRQARMHEKKIVFLWFGSFKNAQCSYAPEWIKKDLARFPRAQVKPSCNKVILESFFHMEYTTLSVFGEETLAADCRAFAALMRHLREFDEQAHTVVMVQVENETGIMGTARERSAEADRRFLDPVPEDFLRALSAAAKHHTNPDASIGAVSEEKGQSWSSCFGEHAEEAFQTYWTARFADQVAAAGRAEYDLPMFVNAWLSQGGSPGEYPSGGPVAEVIDIWKAAAPHIDLIAPDIYVRNFLDVCEEYARPDNPLCIVETSTHSHLAARMVYAIGHYHACCFGPFAVEDMGQPFDAGAIALFGADPSDPLLSTPQNEEEFSWAAGSLKELIPMLASHYGTDQLQAAIGERASDNILSFGQVQFRCDFQKQNGELQANGYALVLQVNEESFYCMFSGCRLHPESADPSAPNLDLLRVEEGRFSGGNWHPSRILNGDETASLSFDKPELLLVRVMTYA